MSEFNELYDMWGKLGEQIKRKIANCPSPEKRGKLQEVLKETDGMFDEMMKMLDDELDSNSL